jgi:hypothetical protein
MKFNCGITHSLRHIKVYNFCPEHLLPRFLFLKKNKSTLMASPYSVCVCVCVNPPYQLLIAWTNLYETCYVYNGISTAHFINPSCQSTTNEIGWLILPRISCLYVIGTQKNIAVKICIPQQQTLYISPGSSGAEPISLLGTNNKVEKPDTLRKWRDPPFGP